MKKTLLQVCVGGKWLWRRTYPTYNSKKHKSEQKQKHPVRYRKKHGWPYPKRISKFNLYRPPKEKDVEDFPF